MPRASAKKSEAADVALPQADLADVPGLGYEEAKSELVGIVARLESGQVGLEESMSLWQRGDALARHCQRWLDRAESAVAGSQAQNESE